MPGPSAALSAFAVVFVVGDVERSLDFYLNALGFQEHFRYGNAPPEYAIVERDAVSIHLSRAIPNSSARGQGIVYVFTTEVDALHRELHDAGCAIEAKPEDFPYGMREMMLRDPDGNRITFGQAIKAGG